MLFKPSALEQYMDRLPESLQILALQAVVEEHDRWERGDLTEEEKRFSDRAGKIGKSAQQTKEAISAKVFS